MDDLPRLPFLVTLPLVLLVSVMFETSGLVVFESHPMFGWELWCFGRLSGCILIFCISCEAIAAILEVDLTGACCWLACCYGAWFWIRLFSCGLVTRAESGAVDGNEKFGATKLLLAAFNYFLLTPFFRVSLGVIDVA